jgi:hypothetical protein
MIRAYWQCDDDGDVIKRSFAKAPKKKVVAAKPAVKATKKAVAPKVTKPVAKKPSAK